MSYEDAHQSVVPCLHGATPWSYWGQAITAGEEPIRLLGDLSVYAEICWRQALEAVRYADPCTYMKSRVASGLSMYLATVGILMELVIYLFIY